jgi:hypothetical protein
MEDISHGWPRRHTPRVFINPGDGIFGSLSSCFEGLVPLFTKKREIGFWHGDFTNPEAPQARDRTQVKVPQLECRRVQVSLGTPRHQEGDPKVGEGRHLCEGIPEGLVGVTAPEVWHHAGLVPVKGRHFPFDLEGLDEGPMLGHFCLETANVIDGQSPTPGIDDEEDIPLVQYRDALHESGLP